MTLDAIQSAVIASMTSTYLVAPSATITDKSEAVKASKPRASKKVAKSDGSQAAPSSHGNKPSVMVASMNLPAKGTYDASGFIVALRRAKDRDESIQAIAGFMGYDLADNFGAQELRAKSLAQSMMVPVIAGKERTAQASVAGFVAGLPDRNQKLIQDLEGRERLAIDALVECNKAALAATSEESRQFHETMAQVESERLESIRKDLSRLV